MESFNKTFRYIIVLELLEEPNKSRIKKKPKVSLVIMLLVSLLGENVFST